MRTMTIGQIAARAGVRSSAIRFYEATGLLPAPSRVAGKRRYTAAVLRDLDLIQTAKEAGFTLREIRMLRSRVVGGATPSAVWRRLAQKKLAEVDLLIARAGAMRQLLQKGLRCRCVTIDRCTVVRDRRQRLPDPS